MKELAGVTFLRTKILVGGLALGVALVLSLSGCAGSSMFSGSKISTNINDYKVSGDENKLFEFETVKDSNGVYTRTFIDASGLKFDNSTKGAFTDAQLKPVLETAMRFVSLEALDSVALDNASEWNTWKKTVAPQYISRNHLNEILNQVPPTNDQGKTSNVILQNTDKLLPVLLRDGGVRIADKRIGSIEFRKGPSGGVEINIDGSAVVFVNDANGAIFRTNRIQVLNPDGTPMSAADIKKNHVKLPPPNETYSDGKPNAALLSFTLSFDYVKEGGKWMISGVDNFFFVGNFDNGDNGQLGFRDNVVKK